MKNLLKLFIGTLVLSLVFASCKKDEEEPVNYMQVGDVSCTLTDGNIIYYGSNTLDGKTIYYYNIELVSKGITLSRGGTGFPVYDGSGVKVYINLYSAEYPRPANGDDYVYHVWSPNNNALNTGYYFLDFVSSKSTGKAFASGTVTVNGSDDSYAITFEGTDQDNAEIALQFTGDLNYYDGEGWIKK